MSYPDTTRMEQLTGRLRLYSQLQHEYGAREIAATLAAVERNLKSALARLRRLAVDKSLAKREPDDLRAIRRLRPAGPRRIWRKFDSARYRSRLEGALLGRMAGCTLGAPVEGKEIDFMQDLARENNEPFPPRDYWTRVPQPYCKRYGVSTREMYTRSKINGVPVDDDVAYTLLGLLIAEDHGLDFTVADVGNAWLKYLPMACTAEHVALENLKAGVPAKKAAEKDNPYCQWIGADIRSDPWGYMAPGLPEFAAEMAYRDAYLSHRRNGIYGEMYFAAAIAAAFAVDDPVEALRIGLTEIPRDCEMARTVRWALKLAPRIRDYRAARAAVDRRFKGMHRVHTLNNACLTIWGVTIGKTDMTKVLGQTVAMGLDNDCTAATAGSVVGAVIGKKNVPLRWYKNFRNTVHSYLTGRPKFTVSGLIDRFERQARKAHAGSKNSCACG